MLKVRKYLTIGTIFLFISITITPGINNFVAEAYEDTHFIDVDVQVCDIKGYENITVKLTRQQYQDLEQFLVEFRARLNTTSTREKAMLLFKEAVIKLNRYRLLPKWMNVERIQRLVTYANVIPVSIDFLEKMLAYTVTYNESENLFCLIAGETNKTWFESPMTVFSYKLFSASISGINGLFFPILGLFSFLTFIMFTAFFSNNRLATLCRINFGGIYSEHELPPKRFYASGWINTQGINGKKTWKGKLQGILPIEGTQTPGMISHTENYPGVVGFTGVKINKQGGTVFYLGSALWVKIDSKNT